MNSHQVCHVLHDQANIVSTGAQGYSEKVFVQPSQKDVDHNREQVWRKGATLSNATGDREGLGLPTSEHDLLDVVLVQGLKGPHEFQGCADVGEDRPHETMVDTRESRFEVTMAGLEFSNDAIRDKNSKSRMLAIMLRPFKNPLWAADTEGA